MFSVLGMVLGLLSVAGVWGLQQAYDISWNWSWGAKIGLWLGILIPALIVSYVWWPLVFVAIGAWWATLWIDDHTKWDMTIGRWIGVYAGLNIVITIVAALFVFALNVFASA